MELTDSMSGAIMDDWGYFIFNVHLIFFNRGKNLDDTFECML